jgi:hypothetical protein
VTRCPAMLVAHASRNTPRRSISKREGSGSGHVALTEQPFMDPSRQLARLLGKINKRSM